MEGTFYCRRIRKLLSHPSSQTASNAHQTQQTDYRTLYVQKEKRPQRRLKDRIRQTVPRNKQRHVHSM